MRLGALPLAAAAVLSTSVPAPPPLGFDPGRPRDLEARADGPFAVELDWRRVGGVDGYFIYRDGNRVGTSERSEYRDEGLQPATTYVYRVSAVEYDDGEEEEGSLSSAVQVTTAPLPGPTTPTDLTAAVVSARRIDLTWSPSEADAGIDFYRVFRDGEEIGTTGVTSWEDEGLTPETTYEYRVSAVDAAGEESDRSAPASATTPAFPPPPPPEDLSATAMSSTQINLTWSAPAASDTPIAGYSVYRGDELLGFVVGTTFADTGLSPGTTYTYTVASVDDRSLEGEPSEEISATTDAAQDVIPPAPPTDLRLSGS